MEKLLILTNDVQKALFMQELFKDIFLVQVVASEEEALHCLSIHSVFAVMQEYRIAVGENYTLVRRISSDDAFSAIPILVFSSNSDDIVHAEECLHAGSSDFLLPPFDRSLLVKRIHNAVRAKESFTFSEIEGILRELPSNIYLKDAEGKYVFATHYWRHIKASSQPNWTIRGKTDFDIRKDKANALKAMESDKVILATGKGTTYVIEENHDGVREFLELVKRPTHDKDGKVNGIVALINNVTEKELLKMELERRATIDPLTGLLNKTATKGLIDIELEKYARSTQGGHGALLMIDVDNFKNVNDTFGHSTGDSVLMCVSSIIHGAFKGMDVKGRVGGDEFMVFACDVSDAATACRLADSIGRQAAHAYDGSDLEGLVSLSIGVSLYPQHGVSFHDLYISADKALYTVKNKGKGSYCVATQDIA